MALAVGAHRGDHRDIARVQHGVDGGGIHIVNVSHPAQLLAALMAVVDIPADAGQAHGLAPQPVDIAHQLRVHLAHQNHLHHPHNILGGVAQAVDEFHGNVQLLQHLIDAGAAAVGQHGLETQELQQHHVVHHGILQVLVDHGVAAVFDDHDLPRVLLQVRHGLHEGFDFLSHVAHCQTLLSCGSRR